MNGLVGLMLVACLVAVHGANIDMTRCGPVCMMYCPFGNVMDTSGCPTCHCNNYQDQTDAPLGVKLPNNCPQVLCLNNCENGFADNGCPTCLCNGN